MSRLLEGLNPPQKDAVLTTSGPLLVLAGAGTGKTRVVTFRIAKLIAGSRIHKKIRPERILAVTFTNKAANEMQERVRALIGKRSKEEPEVSTFHSLCVRILRRNIEHLGYPAKFSIYAAGQQESVARKVLREVSVSTAALKPSELMYRISRWKSNGLSPEEAASVCETDKDHLAAMAYRRYQADIRARGAVDFDDLLLCTERLFREFPEVRQAEAARFDHILVDEYQDTNECQYRIVRALADGHRNLCVVGDDDQSIYSWRGAEVEHILKFASDWPEAKVVRLEDNYRSTEAILSFANRLIKFNKVRHDKVLRAARPNGERPLMCVFKDEEEEAREVVDRIRTQVARPELEYRDFAILFRTNEQPRAFESELRRLKIPYVLIGGMSFFDRREVRDTMAYLRLLDNPHEEVSLLRVLNTPPRGIGNKTVEQLMSVAVADKKPLWDILCKIPSKAGVSKSAAAAIGRFVNMIETYQKELETKKGTEVIRELLLYIDYRGEIARLHDSTADQDSRWATVEEIVNALGAYEDKKRKKKRTIGEFLDEVAVKGLDDKDAKEDKEKQMRRNAVVLMTLHAAKGLEFPNVFMVGMEEGLLPHVRSIKSENAADIEEERRLCYVGVTRAEDNLTLTMSKSRRKWGKAQETQPSRFLFELIGKADNAHNRSDAAHKPRKKMARKKKSSARRRP